jgi:molybdopterin-binding protein
MLWYEVQRLRFDYPDRFRLEIDDFRLDSKEKVSVVGRNGAGKSTLLRVLAFLERPLSWERFRYAGRDVVPGKTPRKGIGLLRQQPWIFRGTVEGNLAYGLRVRRRSRREIRRRVGAMCERLDLTRHHLTPARALSGGEQRRVALGRMLIVEPEVLLLDEPTTHLDEASRKIIGQVLAECDAAVLLMTHDLRLAYELPGRTLGMENGRLSEVLSRNVFSGTCSGGVLTTPGGLEILLPRPPSESKAMVAIDPRSVVISHEPLHSSMRNSFTGRIRSVESEGENRWLEIEGRERFTAVISRKSYEEMELNLDRTVVVSFKINAVQLLQGNDDDSR